MIVRVPLSDSPPGRASCPCPVVTLLVGSRYGEYAKIKFVIDTGADVAAMPIELANLSGLSFQREVEGISGGLVGTTVSYRDALRVLVGRCVYEWPCNFVRTPAGRRASTAVIGRTGFLDAFDFSISDGYLVIIRRGSVAYWCRRICSLLVRPFVRVASVGESL
jgi:hypothetical protein